MESAKSVQTTPRGRVEVAKARGMRNERYLKGVPNIRDEERLKYIVRSIPLPEFCIKAVENQNLKDEEFLEETVLTTMTNAVALKALERLKNAGSHAKLEDILRRSDDEQIQLRAIDGVENENALMEAYANSQFASVRRKAILNEKLNDNSVFRDAIFKDKALPVNRAGVKRTRDTKTLSDVLFQASCGRGCQYWGDGYENVIVDALLNPNLDDQHGIENVIFGDFSAHVKLKAFGRVSRIDNQRMLNVMLKCDADTELRLNAARLSEDANALGKAIREDLSQEVKAACSKRLMELSKLR